MDQSDAQMLLQSDVRAHLVHACQTAITGDVGREYGCKPSHWVFAGQKILPPRREAFNPTGLNRHLFENVSDNWPQILPQSSNQGARTRGDEVIEQDYRCLLMAPLADVVRAAGAGELSRLMGGNFSRFF